MIFSPQFRYDLFLFCPIHYPKIQRQTNIKAKNPPEMETSLLKAHLLVSGALNAVNGIVKQVSVP